LAISTFPDRHNNGKENSMARALILWIMGVPLFLVLLIWYFFF